MTDPNTLHALQEIAQTLKELTEIFRRSLQLQEQLVAHTQRQMLPDEDFSRVQ